MAFEVIAEYPREGDEPAEIVAWISEPDQRDIGIQARIRDDLGLELIEYSDKTRREYGRIFIGRDEFESLLDLIAYAKRVLR